MLGKEESTALVDKLLALVCLLEAKLNFLFLSCDLICLTKSSVTFLTVAQIAIIHWQTYLC